MLLILKLEDKVTKKIINRLKVKLIMIIIVFPMNTSKIKSM